MSLSMKRRQLLSAVGTAGTFDGASLMLVGNANVLVRDLLYKHDAEIHSRPSSSATFGQKPSVSGKRSALITFVADLRGSGVAGTAPSIGKLIRSCGFSETVNSGSAAIGAVSADNQNLTPASVPVVAGTNASTKNGTLVITIETVVANTSIAINAQFFPEGAGVTGYEIENGTQTSATAVTLGGTQLTGITVDFGDPSSSTAGFQAGDVYRIPLTAAATVDVVYKTISTGLIVLDLAVLQDGRVLKAHSCVGNFRANMVNGQPVALEFEFRGVPVTNTGASDDEDGREDFALFAAPTYEAIAPPAFMGLTGTNLRGESPAPCFSSMNFDLGNTIAPRECATAVSGYDAFRITERNPTGSIDPEARLFATKDYFTSLEDGSLGVMNATIGAVSGNIATWSFPNIQVVGIDDGDRDSLALDSLSVEMKEPEFDAGGDYAEVVLTFT